MKPLFAAALILVSAAALADSPPPPVCHYHQAAILPVSYDGDRMLADTKVNGADVPMLIDSGAMRTHLIRDQAQKLGLHFGSTSMTSYGVGGKSSVSYTVADDVVIGPSHGKDVELLVVDDVGGARKYGGLIGADFLFRADVEISPADGQIKFFVAKDCASPFLARWDGAISRVELRGGTGEDNRPRVTVEINGKRITALIDSGADRTVLDTRGAARVGLTPDSPGVKLDPQKESGIGSHLLSSWSVPLETVTIGDETIRNVRVEMADMHSAMLHDTNTQAVFELSESQPLMILGADFLRAHHVLFARSQGQFYFSYLGGKVFQTP
jgi:predicted aspartyl protease